MHVAGHRRGRHEDRVPARRRDRRGRRRARADPAPICTPPGELAVEKVLHEVMESAIGDLDVTPAAVCIGIAGVDRDDEARTVRAIMRRLGHRSRAVVVNDALIALVAAAGAAPGVVIIAGTGSIVYGRNARAKRPGPAAGVT